MDEYQHTVLTRGYRVVAITREEVYAPDAVVAYAVVTEAGTRITPDLSWIKPRSGSTRWSRARTAGASQI